MRVELTDDPTVFRAGSWTRVVEAAAFGTFFHTPAYLKLWWEEFGGGSLLVARALEGDEVVGACCFEVIDGILTFLGGFDVTDYLGPVALPGREEAVATGLVHAMADQVQWDRADLRGLPEGSTWLGDLAAAARSNGLGVVEEEGETAPFIALPSTFEAYIAALPAKLRHEIRRKRRRLVGEKGEYRITMSTSATLREDMDRFLELHRASPGPKGRFMHAAMEIFFLRLAEVFLPPHVFHLAFMEVEGERVAGAIGFGFRGTFSLYNSAFDRKFGQLSPGMVLVADLIRLAIESGDTTFDLLTGDLEYKYRFGPAPRALRRLRISRA